MTKINPDRISRILQGAPQVQEKLEVSFDEIDNFGNRDDIVAMFKNIKKYNDMLKERRTFVNATLTKAIPFTKENLYLICAYSGSGKSTLAANVSYPLWKEGHKSLVISNEESREDVYYRIACLELGFNFNEYKKGMMPAVHQQQCAALFPKIATCVKVADVNFKIGETDNATAIVEGVKALMESVKDSDYACVMIDYFQLIKKSLDNPSQKSYDVLNDFRIWIGQYIKSSNVPVVVFAQLHSLGKRNNKDLDNRIKHCPDIYEPSTVVIEVVPNFEEKTSDFVIHKDRFGLAGMRLICAFDKGRYINIDHEVLEKLRNEKIANLNNLVDGEPVPEEDDE